MEVLWKASLSDLDLIWPKVIFDIGDMFIFWFSQTDCKKRQQVHYWKD